MLLGTTVVQPHFTGSRLASLDSVWGEYYSLGYLHASPVAFRYRIQLDIDISHCNMRQGQLFRRLLRLLGFGADLDWTIQPQGLAEGA